VNVADTPPQGNHKKGVTAAHGHSPTAPLPTGGPPHDLTCPHCDRPIAIALPFSEAHSAALDWCLVLHDAIHALTALLEETLP
jgi:hypothetical protein